MTAQVTPQKAPSASLYVGDLLPEVNEGVLFDIFTKVGQVSSIRVCRDTHTRRSLGYAYVNYQNVNDAERALAALNNSLIAGKQCRIMWSQRDPTVRKLGIGNVFVKSLDLSITHKELYDIFSPYGNISSCKVALNEQGESKGYGFVHFESQNSADAAMAAVNDTSLTPDSSKKVYVGPFVPRNKRNQQIEGSWTNVFVKDIDPSVTDADFQALFTPYGRVTSPVIVRKDGQASHYGFVNFANHEDAVKAVEGLHGQQVAGKALFCCRAQKKNERRTKLRREWEQQKLNKYQGINLYVKHLDDDVDEERLRKEFTVFGPLFSLRIMQEEGVSKGFGFVCFENPEDASRAVAEMNGRVLLGCTKPLYVAFHEPFEVRRQKLAQIHTKQIRPGAAPQGAQIYGAPVFYPPPVQGFGYPQPIMQQMPRAPWGPIPNAAFPVAMSRGGQQRGRGAGAQRGQGTRTKGSRNQPQIDPNFAGQADLSLQILSQHPYDRQKLFIGERLFPLIAQIKGDLAGKITGMFLESGWSVEELFSLLGDAQKLAERIEDAVDVLEKSEQLPHSTEERPESN